VCVLRDVGCLTVGSGSGSLRSCNCLVEFFFVIYRHRCTCRGSVVEYYVHVTVHRDIFPYNKTN
jgi:hypothetical protein